MRNGRETFRRSAACCVVNSASTGTTETDLPLAIWSRISSKGRKPRAEPSRSYSNRRAAVGHRAPRPEHRAAPRALAMRLGPAWPRRSACEVAPCWNCGGDRHHSKYPKQSKCSNRTTQRVCTQDSANARRRDFPTCVGAGGRGLWPEYANESVLLPSGCRSDVSPAFCSLTLFVAACLPSFRICGVFVGNVAFALNFQISPFADS